MEFYIIGLLVAFGAGAFAAAIGAVAAVTLTGLAAMIALLVAPGQGHVDFLGIYAFGLWLGPHVSFGPACAAAGYAGRKGYIVKDGKDILTPLIGTGHVSPIIVGGLFGSLGFLLQQAFAAVIPQVDTIALTVVLICLMGKLFGAKGVGELLGETPQEVKAVGGRFSRHSPVVWLPWQSKGPIQTTMGIAMGALAGWGAWMMMQNPDTQGLAILPGWAIGVVCFFFFGMGLKIPVTHHTTMVAGLATVAAFQVSQSPVAILWGVAFGVASNYGAEWLSRVWTVHGHGFVDPPASVIFFASALVWAGKELNVFQDQFIIPSVILVAGIAYALFVAAKDKDLDSEESVMEEQGLDRIEAEPLS